MKTMKTKALIGVLLLLLVWVVPAGAEEKTAFDFDSISLRVGVWTDKGADEVYQRGDRMTAGFQVDEDAYAVVYRIDTEGLVTVLWPRGRFDDGFVFGGHEYELPVTGAAPLTVGDAEGEGYIEALVSRYPFDLRGLEIDFHHESGGKSFDYFVAGDPFLAMNEVNFAITGLEDSSEYVVTNYAAYFVHRQVDHPRYLCGQCHLDNEVAYDPYSDHCTLEITYDYGWGNRWYDHYGYYPVYAQPVYVYVDPWTRRPWVNFWYWPHYTCGPSFGYTWYSDCWAWCDSPYYRGDIYVNYDSGHRRYRPLTPFDGDRGARKTREYTRVSPLVKADGPDRAQRDAMVARTRPVAGAATPNRTATGTRLAEGSAADSFRGEPAVTRTRPVIDKPVRQGAGPGLRIREPGDVSSGGQIRSREQLRHVAGDGSGRPSLTPVSRTRTPGVGGDRPATVGSPNPAPGVRKAPQGGDTPARTIKPVEPRKKGTRIWNSTPTGSERSPRSPQTAPRQTEPRNPDAGEAPRVQPRRDNSRRQETVKPRAKEADKSRDGGSSSPAARPSGSGSRDSGKSEARTGQSSRSSSGGSSRSSAASGSRRAP